MQTTHSFKDLLRKRTSYTALISPIRSCNIRCKHCFITNLYKDNKEVMDADFLVRTPEIILESALNFPIVPTSIEYLFMGGEVHLLSNEYIRTNFLECSKRAIKFMDDHDTKFAFDIAILSNLIGVTKKKLDSFVFVVNETKKLIKKSTSLSSKNMNFIVSTSFEPDTDRFVGSRTYQRWLDNIKYLQDNGILINIACTLTKGVVDIGYEDLFNRFNVDLGAEIICDYYSPSHGNSINSNLTPSYESLENFMINALEFQKTLRSKNDDIMSESPHNNLHSRWLCVASIDVDGAVALDSEGAADQHEFNDELINLKKLTTKEAAKALIKLNFQRIRTETHDILESKCGKCEYLYSCLGGYRHFNNIYTDKDQCSGLKKFMKAYSLEQKEYFNIEDCL